MPLLSSYIFWCWLGGWIAPSPFSRSGYLCFVNGCLVSWCSKKQPMVATSSKDAEIMSAYVASTESFWIRGLLFVDLGTPENGLSLSYGLTVLLQNNKQLEKSVTLRTNISLQNSTGLWNSSKMEFLKCVASLPPGTSLMLLPNLWRSNIFHSLAPSCWAIMSTMICEDSR